MSKWESPKVGESAPKTAESQGVTFVDRLEARQRRFESGKIISTRPRKPALKRKGNDPKVSNSYEDNGWSDSYDEVDTSTSRVVYGDRSLIRRSERVKEPQILGPIIINNRIYSSNSNGDQNKSRRHAESRGSNATNIHLSEAENPVHQVKEISPNPSHQGGSRDDVLATEQPSSWKTEDSFSGTIIRLDPLAPQDITVHMALDTGDDLESDLEEHSRLRRLGRFLEAREQGHDKLEHYLDNAYVRCHIGQTLLEMQDFAYLQSIAEEYPPNLLVGKTQICWYFLLQVATSISDLDFTLDTLDEPAPTAATLLRPSWPSLDSTEVCICVLP
jgi:hypothetical protein